MSVDIIYKTFFNDDGYEVSVIDNASSSGNAGLLIIPVVGLIAIGTDSITGASFEYPPELHVEMLECKAPTAKPAS